MSEAEYVLSQWLSSCDQILTFLQGDGFLKWIREITAFTEVTEKAY